MYRPVEGVDWDLSRERAELGEVGRGGVVAGSRGGRRVREDEADAEAVWDVDWRGVEEAGGRGVVGGGRGAVV